MRLTILFGVFAILSSTPTLSAEDERQVQFSHAMTLIEQGHPILAAQILTSLYETTHEPRVRLELARASFLAQDLDRARKLFVSAYEDNPPPPVKARILQYIDEIDRRLGKLSFSLSATHARNPYRMPSQFGINFAGSYLNLEQNPKQRNVYGLLYTGSYEKKFTSENDIRVQGSFRDLEHKAGDFGFGDISIGQSMSLMPIEIRIGFQILEMNRQSYRMPYIETSYQLKLMPEARFIPMFQVGSFQPRDQNGLVGTSYKLSLPIELNLNAHRTFKFGIKTERRTAKYSEQAFWSTGPYIDSKIDFAYINFSTSLAFRKTNYDEMDPFWSVRRKDTSIYGSFSAETDRFKFHGLIPSLGFYCDLTKSNVDYYTARDCGISTNLKKNY